ncbi:MAG TPA: hypothetical protein VF530_16880 [Planctomycetota bacterium]
MSYRTFRRREALRLFLPGLTALVLAPRALAGTPPLQAPMSKIMLYPLGGASEPGELDLPEVSEVSAALRLALSIERGAASDCVRDVLTLRYGSALSEESFAPQYKQVWVVDHWEIVCCRLTAFVVTIGKAGVAIDVEESMNVG